MLVAFALRWIGNVCLLSERSSLFLFGLAFFLLAHIAFSTAFAADPLSLLAAEAALAVMVVVGVLTLAWLWRRLNTPYKVAIGAYVAAIVAMYSLAVAYGVATGS